MIRKIALKDAGDFFAGTFSAEMRKAASKGLYSAALRSVNLITTQEISRISPAPIDRAIYKAGWRAERDGDGAVISNAVPYAAAIEYGVPAANVVISNRALQQIGEWAMRKLGVPKERAPVVARRIMLKMQKRGIFRRGEGLKILETFVRERLPDVIRDEVQRELAKL